MLHGSEQAAGDEPDALQRIQIDHWVGKLVGKGFDAVR
jgi:hypothetical protein